MDYVPSPESFYAPDFVKSTFAASPNSLYMYDQERHDMQNTLSNGMFGQTCPGTGMVQLIAEPEFDLNPQFENSNSLEGFFGGALTRSLMPSPCEGSIGGSASGRSEKPDSTGLLGLLEVSQQELKMGGPTLAELNMDPFLMEDIDNLIENEEEEKKPVVGAVKQMGCSDVMKQLTAGQSGQMEAAPKTLTTLNSFNPTTTTTSLSSQPRAEPTQLHTQPLSRPAAPLSSPYGGNRTLNVAVVPPISVSATTTIKTEPMDTYESGDKPCLHKMLSSSPPAATQRAASVSPPQCGSASPGRRVMPVVGQARAPPLGQQVKAESVEEKWKEIEKFIHDPETSSSSSSRKRKRHESGGSAIMSDEEDSVRLNFSDEDDSDSDGDSDMSDSPLDESLTEMAKKSKQYFWQYNVQAKGPKGTRLKLNIGDTDPHHPSNFEDPVFDASSTSLVGIRHGGKARKGDGNEVTPNPRKLFQIGKQLYKLNRQINGFQVSNDLPASVRNKSRKEKNKLASRACRLKKKAQHEANKVKLTGLGCEQSELLEVIHLIWPLLKERAQQHMKGLVPSPGYTETLSDRLDAIIQSQRKTIIAGNTTDYVNEVIAKVEEGDPTGGLPIKPRVKK